MIAITIIQIETIFLQQQYMLILLKSVYKQREHFIEPTPVVLNPLCSVGPDKYVIISMAPLMPVSLSDSVMNSVKVPIAI